DLVYRLRGARGEDVAAGIGDQHVVLDADADAAQLGRDGVRDLLGLRLLFLLDLLGGAGAQPVAALPRLVLVVLAQVGRRRLALGLEVEPGVDRRERARVGPARPSVGRIGADVLAAHARAVRGAG